MPPWILHNFSKKTVGAPPAQVDLVNRVGGGDWLRHSVSFRYLSICVSVCVSKNHTYDYCQLNDTILRKIGALDSLPFCYCYQVSLRFRNHFQEAWLPVCHFFCARHTFA